MAQAGHNNTWPFLAGDGEMARLIAGFDWSATAMGPIGSWPQSVRSVISLVLRSDVPIVTLWHDDGVMIYNDGYSVFAGSRHPSLLGSKVLEGWPEVAEFNAHVMRSCYHAGGTLAYTDQELTLNRDGRPGQAWMNLDYSPILDEAGKPCGVIAIVIETTSKVRAEQRVGGERERLRQMFEQAPGFMALLSGPQHVFDFCNPRYLQLIGHRDIVGKPLFEALPELHGQGYGEILDKVYETGEPFFGSGMKADLQYVAGGPVEVRFVDVVYQPIREDGAVTGILVQGLDVTERILAAQALERLNQTLEERVAERTASLQKSEAALYQAQKMETVGQLTGGVAHDFNNLLQVVTGNLQLLAVEVQGNERAQRQLANALAGAQRGAKLSSQLLAFARRQPLEPRVLKLGRLVQGMDEMLRRSIGDAVEMETVLSGGLWNTLADPAQIENALLNLVINARDAMGGLGKLTIEVANAHLDDAYAREHPDATAGQHVMLAVTDTGSGMTPEVMQKAFEPFFSTKPEGKGTGLGLSMVYGFIKQSGGHVKIYSELGHGTSVKLYLPRTLSQEDSLEPAQTAAVTGGSETVLVAEDDDQVRETVVAMLGHLGYKVLTARDAAGALAILQSGVAVDVLFTDVVMPGPLRSPELARKAKTLMPGIAVLFTSGYTQNAIVHGGRLDAGVELLGKPYTQEALARKIRLVLGNQRPREGLSPAPAATPAPAAAPVSAPAAAPVSAPAGGLRILFVEDDELVRSSTAEILSLLGHEVHEAGTAADALAALQSKAFDVMLADMGLPDMNGVQLAAQARISHPHLPVVFASGAPVRPLPALAVELLKPFSVEGITGALAAAVQAAAQ